MKLSSVINKQQDLTDEKEIQKEDFNRFDDVVAISEEVSKDLSSTEYKPSVVKRANPILVIELYNELELKFIKSLLYDRAEDSNDKDLCIEMCVRLDTLIKPIGFLEFTFDNMMKILSYNDTFYVALKRDKEIQLTTDMILNLP